MTIGEPHTTPALVAPLDEYLRQFQALENDARQLATGLSHRQFNWSPEAGRWSIAECLVHLNAVARPYGDAMSKSIEGGRHRARAAGGSVRYSWLERWMIRSLEPPPKRRLPAPAMFRPAATASDHSATEVMDEFVGLKHHFIELLIAANDLDIGRIKITSPVSRLIRLRLGAAFAFIASHERRHLWQARQVRTSAGFPDS